METNTSHADIVKRLKRIDGHIKSVIDMIEEERSCLEIAQQMQAIQNALIGAKKTLIHDHINHCLAMISDNSSNDSKNSLNEFKRITKYL